MTPFVHEFYVNLRTGAAYERAKKPLSQGNSLADKIVVHVQDCGSDVDLSGMGVSALVVRFDGQTVPLTGTIEDGAACITLDKDSYAVPGEARVTVMLSAGEMVQTVLVLLLNVDTSQTSIVVDNGTIGDLTDLLGAIADMRFATAEALEAAEDVKKALDSLPEVYSTLEADVDELERSVAEIAPQSVNLFNREILTDGYLNGSGNLVANSTYVVTDYIRCVAGDVFTVPFMVTCGLRNAFVYDYAKNYIPSGSNPTYTSVQSADGAYMTYTIVATAAAYVRFNLDKSAVSGLMVVHGDTYPEEYIPYGRTLDASLYEGMLPNPLRGKILAVNGDSICYGAGYAGGYAGIIAERNSMVLENKAVSGATITAGTTIADTGANRHWVCRTIDRMREDADYIILEGGVNDAGLFLGGSLSGIGSLTANYTAAVDDTTYAGAFESMLRQALARWPGKKIGYIAVHKMVVAYDSRYTEDSFYHIALAACAKYGIPVCDLNVLCPPLGYMDDLKAAYTKDGDGWHPNEAGYKQYYCDKIEAWMRTL